mmetsp:Transcript_3989/g.10882  ORF Transcript_3989/g.10882 Transcript_3989/m.10882 type:complete len:217 (-) Transcript_3989:142-792(-)
MNSLLLLVKLTQRQSLPPSRVGMRTMTMMMTTTGNPSYTMRHASSTTASSFHSHRPQLVLSSLSSSSSLLVSSAPQRQQWTLPSLSALTIPTTTTRTISSRSGVLVVARNPTTTFGFTPTTASSLQLHPCATTRPFAFQQQQQQVRGKKTMNKKSCVHKRFRMRGNGSLKRYKAGHRHNTGKKSKVRQVRLGQSGTVQNKKVEKKLQFFAKAQATI